MAIRWSKGVKHPLHAIKRGMASLFVCAVVLLPLILAGVQINSMIASNRDPRQATALPAMQVRSIDQSDASLNPFNEPLITVTFDDGWETIYSQALPILHANGIPTTQYVLSGYQKNFQYMSFAQMRTMQQAGHEIGCHSIDHQDLTTIGQSILEAQLTGCKQVIDKELGINVREFASPYGHSNPTTIRAISDVYRSHRNTNGDIITNAADDEDVNTKANFNRYDIICITLRRDTTVQQLQAAIDYTVKNNGWLVLNYHQVDDSGSEYSLDNESLKAQMSAVSQSQARVVTIGQVLDAMEAKR